MEVRTAHKVAYIARGDDSKDRKAYDKGLEVNRNKTNEKTGKEQTRR